MTSKRPLEFGPEASLCGGVHVCSNIHARRPVFKNKNCKTHENALLIEKIDFFSINNRGNQISHVNRRSDISYLCF